MKKLILLLALGMLICLPGMAMATVINFDGLTTPISSYGWYGNVNYNDFSGPYAGFTWSGGAAIWGVVQNSSYDTAYGNTTVFPSPPNAAYNENGANVVSFSSTVPVNIQSASFAYWSLNDGPFSYSSSTVTVTGYLNGIQVGSPVTVALTTSFQSADLGLIDVNSVTFTNDGGPGYWLMDNLYYSAVPLPPSVLLLGSGLFGLGILGRRKIFKA